MNIESLHDLVGEKIEVRWSDWAGRHPHLAGAIDRIRLIEATVSHLRDDPDFVAAMREADLDEAALLRASRLLQRADELVQHILPD